MRYLEQLLWGGFSLASAFVALAPRPALAQTPLGRELLVSSDYRFFQSPPHAACSSSGACILTWRTAQAFDEGNNNWVFARTLSPQGDTLAERQIRFNDGPGIIYPIGLADGFALFWDKTFPGSGRSPVFQLFDEALVSRGEIVKLPFIQTQTYGATFAAGATPQGYVVLSPFDDEEDDPSCSGCYLGVFAYFVDFLGQPVGEPRRANEDTSGYERPGGLSGGLAVDGAGNVLIAFWRAAQSYLEERDVYVRRFSPEGQPLGPEIRVNSHLPGSQWNPQVAAAPGGEFLVVWQSADQDGESDGIYGQFFSAAGVPAGPELRINQITLSAQRFPTVAADPHGNFVVTWQSFDPRFENGIFYDWEIKARLFRPDGTAVAGEVLVNQQRRDEQTIPNVAFAPNGTFLVGWQDSGQFPNELDPYARRFAASPGQEPCAVAGAQLLCDTGRTGGIPELKTSFGGRPGEVTLLGDFDGDGRDDVCAWRAGRFRCDLDHEGSPAERAVDFGRTGDVPLLGDVDGDGRAEPCLRRKRRLLCDSGHDGGRAETIVVLGRGPEIPLLGDMDGDGQDDLCLVERGQWTCRTAAGAVTRFAFGEPGDPPALGDLDRDGRSEPCVLREGVLRCDTAHDGGLAEGTLALDLPPGARPVFGNLDGL